MGSQRIMSGMFLVLFLPLMTFTALHFIPGNYFDAMKLDPQISKETVIQYEKMYHLDKPFWAQYLIWLKNFCHFDLGYSFAYKQPVLAILGSRMRNTFLLTSFSLLWAWLFAIVLGLTAGMFRGKWPDRLLTAAVYAVLSVPSFFLCILLLYASYRWTSLPLGGMVSVDYESFSIPEKILDTLRHLLVPSLALGLGTFAHLFRVMRGQTAEVKDQDFVLSLRAHGVPEHKIVFKHIARHAINPMISLLGMELPMLFSGSAIVEIMTGWPGLGQMMLQAVRSQDLYLVLGNIVLIAFLLTAGNLIADILLLVADPRIRPEVLEP
jgi:peptide/nickel transport system permease protein